MNSVAKDAQQRFELGVVLVHGIGMQESGETLTRWGDVLVDTIRRATRNRVEPTIERAVRSTESTAQAQMILRFGDGEKAPRWLLSEGWWANAFIAPSYGELVSWSLKALPWFVAMHVARRYWAHSGQGWSRTLALANAVLQLLVLLAFTPLFLVLLALTLVLGLLPIAQLRSVILRMQSMLTATVGDSLAFVASPVRAGFIRTRILDSLKHHKAICDKTVVLAHSQGAAAVLDALGAMTEPDEKAKTCKVLNVPPEQVMPDTLVTFGAGTNQLASQRALVAGVLKQFHVNPPVYAIGAMLALAVIVWLSYVDVRAGRLDPQGILHAGGLMLATLAGVTLLAWLVQLVLRFLASKYDGIKKLQQQLTAGALFVLGLGAVLFLLIYPQLRGTPSIETAVFGSLAILVLAGTLFLILSRDLKTAMSLWVRKPPALNRWIDLYASADPVPNGPTDTMEEHTPGSVQIWNEDSFVADHTTYWDNLDGFALRTVRACAETAHSSWLRHLPPQNDAVDARAEWRVGFLRLTRWLNAALWVFLGAQIWFEFFDRVPLVVETPEWLSTSTTRLGIFVVAVAACAWVSYAVMRWLWRRWARNEQEAVLAGKQPSAEQAGPLFLMGALVWLLLFGSLAFAVRGEEFIRELASDPREYLLGLMMAFSWAAISYVVLTRWPRPPVVYRNGEAQAKPA